MFVSNKTKEPFRSDRAPNLNPEQSWNLLKMRLKAQEADGMDNNNQLSDNFSYK